MLYFKRLRKTNLLEEKVILGKMSYEIRVMSNEFKLKFASIKLGKRRLILLGELIVFFFEGH